MKHVLFTGATGGLGEVCVKVLSNTDRWMVFAAGTNKSKLQAFQALNHAVSLQMDITDDLSVLAAQKTVAEYTDRLDAIVNFAGCSAFASMAEGYIFFAFFGIIQSA